MRLLTLLLMISALVGCAPPGEILLVLERGDSDEPRVFDADGRPAERVFEGDGDGDVGDGDGDIGDGDGDIGDGDGDIGDGDGDIGDGDGDIGDGDGDIGDGDGDIEPPNCTYQWTNQPFEFVDVRGGQCDGQALTRYDAFQNLWVGMIGCAEERWRVYLSEEQFGLYFPTVDWAGSGQDHCELVNPTFFLNNEDDINSGSCSACEATSTLPLVGLPVWARGFYGAPFEFVDESEPSYFASDLYCGNDPQQCVFDFDG
jgi:hypothetical protein